MFIGAWETVTSAVADLGEAAADSVSNAVGSIASDAYQGEAQGLLESLNLTPDLSTPPPEEP